MRRVGSIAIVHETLSQNLDERVEFDEIADRVWRWSARSPRRAGKVRVRRDGTLRHAGAEVATPLSMVLTELLQNALEHGFGDAGARHGRGAARSAAARGRTARRLVTVHDDGAGLPDGLRPATGRRWACRSYGPWWREELGGTFDPGRREPEPGPWCGWTAVGAAPLGPGP